MKITCLLRATIEVNSLQPEDHKFAFECIEDAVEKLRELGSCDVIELETA